MVISTHCAASTDSQIKETRTRSRGCASVSQIWVMESRAPVKLTVKPVAKNFQRAIPSALNVIDPVSSSGILELGIMGDYNLNWLNYEVSLLKELWADLRRKSLKQNLNLL